MAQYSDRYGGVGAPVGLTVFKTAGGSLGAVPGGFDSHTPLLCGLLFSLRFPSLARKKSTFHRLLGKSPRARAPSTTFLKDSSRASSEKSRASSEKIWGQLRHLFVHCNFRTDFLNVVEGHFCAFTCIFSPRHVCGTAPLTGEKAQATLRGRPRGRLGSAGSGKGRVRGRPRRFGSTQGTGATLYINNSETLQM
jgi:hypothetical protein